MRDALRRAAADGTLKATGTGRQMVDGFTVEFGGEDLLHPKIRERLDDAKAMLAGLHEQLQEYTGPFDLPEPDDALDGIVQRITEREIRNVPTR